MLIGVSVGATVGEDTVSTVGDETMEGVSVGALVGRNVAVDSITGTGVPASQAVKRKINRKKGMIFFI